MGAERVGDLGSLICQAQDRVCTMHGQTIEKMMSKVEELQEQSGTLVSFLQAVQNEASRDRTKGIDLKNIPDYVHKLQLFQELLPQLKENQTKLSEKETQTLTENLRLEIQKVNARIGPESAKLCEQFNQRKDIIEAFNKLLERYIAHIQGFIHKQRIS